MAEYIEREKVKNYPIRLDHYDEKNGNLDFVLGIESVLEYVDDIPAADVVEVRHGEWVKAGSGITERIVCSHCHSHKGSYLQPPFCSQCGATMDGERRNNNG